MSTSYFGNCVPTWDTLIACVMENDMFESCHRRFCIILSWSTRSVKIVWFYFKKQRKMFANFNKYACDFVSVDDFCYVNTDDVEKAMDVATVEVDKVDSQGGICY